MEYRIGMRLRDRNDGEVVEVIGMRNGHPVMKTIVGCFSREQGRRSHWTSTFQQILQHSQWEIDETSTVKEILSKYSTDEEQQ